MLITFDRDLSRQQIHADGAELATVMGLDVDDDGRRVTSYPRARTLPVAAIDRPVLVTDHYRISSLPCVARDTVFALLGSDHRTVVYDGTTLPFEQTRYPSVWGPSIDTLLLCRALARLPLHAARTAIEIGAGSGFVSRYLLEHAPRLEALDVVDANPEAVACARAHIHDARARFVHADGREAAAVRRHDLIICNPPYIPRPRAIDDNAYEGISLLRWLAADGRGHLAPGGRIVTNVSSLCAPLVAPALAEGGLRVRELDALTVPLKVFNVLNNPRWMAYLLDRGLLAREPRDGYDYWHTIRIVALEP